MISKRRSSIAMVYSRATGKNLVGAFVSYYKRLEECTLSLLALV